MSFLEGKNQGKHFISTIHFTSTQLNISTRILKEKKNRKFL